MYNAIKVLYSYTGDDGGSESGETDWGTDVDSINEFGRKEAIHSSGGETTAEAATALRDTVLAGAKKANAPSISVQGAGEEAGATLTCSGRYHQLEWRYHTDTGGYEANEQTGERTLLGWTYTSATIGFVQSPYNRLCDYNSHLAALDADDQLLVSGTYGGSNNGLKVVKTKVGGDPESYTATTISFDPADDVLDSAGGLGFVRNNRIKHFGSRRNPHLGNFHKNSTGTTQTFDNIKSIVHMRVVNKPLPANRRTRFFKVNAHNQTQTVRIFIICFFKFLRIFHRCFFIMNRTRANN
jgi:hypothetical protein